MKTIFCILFVIISQCSAELSIINDKNSSLLDSTHKNISNKVIDYSQTLDSLLYNILYSNDNPLDVFYKTEKFVDATSKSFVSLKFSYDINSLYDDKYNFNINARIPLSKTQKRFNLFIQHMDKDNIKTLSNPNQQDTTSPEIGLNYFVPELYYITSKYSIGINGLNAFVRARYFIDFVTKYITIEPVQKLSYSIKDEFDESSLLYFDSNKLKNSLIRLVLYRQTQTTLKGMDYGTVLSYYKKLNDKTAINLSQSCAGNTKYPLANNGFYNYTTAFNFRRNFFKKWLFYELIPSVNYHIENDYKANYSFMASVEFYFGKF